MTTFGDDAYVVRFGLRGWIGSVGCAAIWTALTVFVLVRPVDQWIRIAVNVAEVVLVLVAGRDVRRARSGEVLFAVHAGGVHFSSDGNVDDVPWAEIRAVELFTERVPRGRSQQVHHCIAVRTQGTQPVAREGNTPGAGRVPRSSAKYFEDAGRLDLLPGADGTIRWTSRRMRGWRVDRRHLVDAVQRFAPGVPVIDGPDWPPTLTVTEAMAARRVKRARRR